MLDEVAGEAGRNRRGRGRPDRPAAAARVGSDTPAAAATPGLCLTPAAAGAYRLTTEQQGNAAAIVAVAVTRRLPAGAPVAALAVALPVRR